MLVNVVYLQGIKFKELGQKRVDTFIHCHTFSLHCITMYCVTATDSGLDR